MILLHQMFVLFMLMAVGIICRKTGLMNDYVSKGMSGVVVNIASPAFILTAGINKEEYVESEKLLLTALVALIIYVALIIIAIVLPKILRVHKSHIGTYRVMTIFSNIGFMGFPIVSATYGSLGLLYASIFQFPYNLLIYTYGIQEMKPKAEKEESGEEAFAKREPLWKKVVNAGVISVFLSVTLYLLKVHVPEPVEDVIASLSGLTVPLSMMVIGYSLGGMKIKSLLGDKRLVVFTFVKLIVIPIVGIALIRLFITDPILLGVCFIMIATPVGSMTAMLAQAYGGDEDTASRGVALSTMMSVVTIPMMGLLMGV